MSREALFHADPRTEHAAECVEQDCDSEHFGLMVRGFRCIERFSCKHEVNVVYWHELTPVDHPAPTCGHGCTMQAEVIG
jgi:hypothetical protein